MFCHYSSIRNQILLKVAEKTLASQLDLSKISDIQNFYYAKNEVRGLSWWPSGKESACQGRRHKFEPWSRKIPHAMEQLSPCARTTEAVLWSLGATATETVCATMEVCVLRSLCTTTGETTAMRSARTESSPGSPQLEKSQSSNEIRYSPK